MEVLSSDQYIQLRQMQRPWPVSRAGARSARNIAARRGARGRRAGHEKTDDGHVALQLRNLRPWSRSRDKTPPYLTPTTDEPTRSSEPSQSRESTAAPCPPRGGRRRATARPPEPDRPGTRPRDVGSGDVRVPASSRLRNAAHARLDRPGRVDAPAIATWPSCASASATGSRATPPACWSTDLQTRHSGLERRGNRVRGRPNAPRFITGRSAS